MRSKQSLDTDIDTGNLPRHVAIVMDGNGRWAEKRALPRNAGHRKGLETARSVMQEAARLGLEHLTLYMFSTENWKRPKEEVDFLMSLPGEFWRRERETLERNNIRLRALGDIAALPEATRDVLTEALEVTAGRTGLSVNLAINYGGRQDILQAAKALAQVDSVSIATMGEDQFASFLYTMEIPEVDLFIRPGGEMRVSNFLLWQIAYAELAFSETLWPDYRVDEFHRAIVDFQQRKRRRGGLSST
ncbi:MAG TPA: polyprenyl diphosphate synthase [Bacillota bacterium]|nr:polyprenyl diphosphate synthase [Bacillota bacterium]